MIDELLLMALLERLRDHPDERESWTQLMRLLWGYLVQSAGRWLGPRFAETDREDIAQEVLLCIYEEEPWEFATRPRMFLAFVRRVVHRRVVDFIRKTRTDWAHLEPEASWTITEWTEAFLAGASETEVCRQCEEELEDLQARLAQDELDRQILAERAAGCTQDEVAERLGVDNATVWRRLNRMKRVCGEGEKKWKGERRGVSPPWKRTHGGLTPRRSPPRLFLALGDLRSRESGQGET